MLQVKGNDIVISYGDTLDIVFRVTGFEIVPSDRIIFSVKNELFDEDTVITKEFTNIEGTDINIIISSEEMKKLSYGINYYDILCINADNKVNINFPAKLIVEKVVHNE